MLANLENSAVTTVLKKSVFIPIPKKGNAKECSNYRTTAFISHARKVILKILQVKFQQMQTVNFHMFKLYLEKAKEPKIKLPTSAGSSNQQENFRKKKKKIYFWFVEYAKGFDCVDHKKLWKNIQEMGIPDYLTCLLRNLYAGQEATVRTGLGTTDWFQIGKRVHQFSSVTQSCPIHCDPMDYSTPGLPVHHQLPEFTQTHLH